jgi:hypothetical protein
MLLSQQDPLLRLAEVDSAFRHDVLTGLARPGLGPSLPVGSMIALAPSSLKRSQRCLSTT